MKIKIILLSLLILLIPIYAIAEINIFNGEIHGNFEFGHDLENDVWFTDLSLQYDFKIFLDLSIFGGTKTVMDKDGYHGIPFKDIYTIGGKVQYKMLYLQYEHYCVHSKRTYLLYRNTFGNVSNISIGTEW